MEFLPNHQDITLMLQAWREGDEDAASRLMALVMNDLRGLARQALAKEYVRPLDPTELVNEAYIRLVHHPPENWSSRYLFLGYVSRCLNQVLGDLARARSAQKRGGGAREITLNTAALGDKFYEILELNLVLEELKACHARRAEVVVHRFFGGLSFQETAQILNVAEVTIKRDWKIAKQFLYQRLQRD